VHIAVIPLGETRLHSFLVGLVVGAIPLGEARLHSLLFELVCLSVVCSLSMWRVYPSEVPRLHCTPPVEERKGNQRNDGNTLCRSQTIPFRSQAYSGDIKSANRARPTRLGVLHSSVAQKTREGREVISNRSQLVSIACYTFFPCFTARYKVPHPGATTWQRLALESSR
jgi:hypothetical protein